MFPAVREIVREGRGGREIGREVRRGEGGIGAAREQDPGRLRAVQCRHARSAGWQMAGPM